MQCLQVFKHSKSVKVKERKTVSLKTRTLEEQIVAKRLREACACKDVPG